MSTFGGFMPEFPEIRVDYFRAIPGHLPPLACFLSHVHSDHLAGLESLKSPFVYCSAATRELLLRLERYPHRLNFSKGILESHKQQYKHLKNLLKPIPLETPTRIELSPGNDLQVTLFDANHCTGAVMFLIENDNKAVLYTGDIRSEPWFVNALTRNPFLIEYCSGLKKLDCIYLDTSNTNPVEFPTKADGLKELLQKVSKYPPDTVFHFTAWTFGYEEVWMALSRALKSQIHVDNYKLRLYQSLRGDLNDKTNPSTIFSTHDGPVLAGYQCGNAPQKGCLTSDIDVRIHSCEKGMHCKSINESTVWIRPIVTRTKSGVEIGEIGVGGGGGDLTRRPELLLDNGLMIDQFLGLFADTEDLVMQDIKRMLLEALRSTQRSLPLDDMKFNEEQDDVQLKDLTKVLAKSISEKRSKSLSESLDGHSQGEVLPRVITFPYSRHSSYPELCDLVKAFDPKDVYPCTVNEGRWYEGVSMRNLFGHECSATSFRHDEIMRELHAERRLEHWSQQTQTTIATQVSQMLPPPSPLLLKRTLPERATRSPALVDQAQILSPDAHRHEHNSGSTGHAQASTPPSEIVAVSPGSASQSVRRKAILEGLRHDHIKRARINEPDASSLLKSHEYAVPASTRSPVLDGIREMSPELSQSSNYEPEEFNSLHDSSYDDADADVGNMQPYFDDVDDVYRCGSCGHELWSPIGECTGCAAGEEYPYVEILDPESGAQPEFAHNDYAEQMSSESRAELVDDYLDNNSSAYDSLDEMSPQASKIFEEYDVDSFIDDEIQSSIESESSSVEGDEIDYKSRFETMHAAYHRLEHNYESILDQHDLLIMDHEHLRRHVLGSDYDSFDDMGDMDSYNEEGILLVDVAAPDPVIAEVVVSHLEGDSQASEISPERVRDRVLAFQAAVDGSGWHNISLVSAGDNHTFEEIEL